MDRKAEISKVLAAFGAGFASFLGQGAVFRDFLGVFEGGELSVGIFLFFWLLWICVGALAARVSGAALAFAARNFRLLLLLYIPALALQLLLVASAREIAGVSAYEIFPFGKLLLASCLASAPLSLLTGFLFVAAAEWMKGSGAPAAKVYAWETLGSCAGALASTFLLSFGLGDAQISLAAGAGLAAIALASSLMAKDSWRIQLAALLLCLLPLAFGQGSKWDFQSDRAAFARVVPDGVFKGCFSTRQARYLTGEREGQFLVVSSASVIENLPGGSASSLQALALLSECPKTKRIMVAGQNSLSLCITLSELGEVESINYSSLDPEYPEALFKNLPSGLRERLGKIKPSKLDPKGLLETERGYDLAVINSVNMASISSIRFASKEFLQSVKASLSNDGVLAYSFPGAERSMGSDLARLGASIDALITETFSKTVLKPGNPATLFASGQNSWLSGDPKELLARSYKIRGLAEICEPENLLDLFDESSAKWQGGVYRKRAEGAGGSLNAALAYSAKQMGIPERAWKLLWIAKDAIPIALAAYLTMRFLWFSGLKFRRLGEDALFARPLDSGFMVFASAFASSSLFIALLAKQQIAYGSLATYFGAANALFMAGSFIGALLPGRFAKLSSEFQHDLLIAIYLFGSMLWLAAMAPQNGIWALPFQFAIAGLYCGFSVGFCAGELKNAGVDGRRVASSIEFADCFGGAIGGLAAALVFLPIVGMEFFAFPGLCIFAASLPLLASRSKREEPRGHRSWLAVSALFIALGIAVASLALFRDALDLHGMRLKFAIAALLAAALLARLCSLKHWEICEMPSSETKLSVLAARSWLLWLGGALACLALALLLVFGGAKLSAQEPGASASKEAVQDDPKGKPRKADVSKLKDMMKAGRLSSQEASFWIPAEGL